MQDYQAPDIIPFSEYKQMVDKLVDDGIDVAEAVGVVNERVIGGHRDGED